MQIDTFIIALPPGEVSTLFRSLPLPEGTEVTRVSLGDGALEVTLKSPASYGLPVKVRMEIQSFSGALIKLKVRPPVKLNWSNTVRPLITAIPGAMYTGYSFVDIDAIQASNGKLADLTIRRLNLSESGLLVELSNVTVNASWADLLGSM